MNIQTKILDDVLIAEVDVDTLDVTTVKSFTDALSPVLEGHRWVVLKLNLVEFLDSCGLGSLLSLQRKIKARGGELALSGIRDQVATVFKLVNMERAFTIFSNEEEAVKTYGK